jgi:hypothetical protein
MSRKILDFSDFFNRGNPLILIIKVQTKNDPSEDFFDRTKLEQDGF